MKTRNNLVILPIMLLAMTSCGNPPASGPVKPEPPVIDEHYYKNITQRVDFDENNASNFVDDITNGLNDNIWVTLDGFWENGGQANWHNGVRRRNLFYTKDNNNNGYLAMKARGRYNKEDPSINGKAEGACIESKLAYGPGRFEVTMAAMPRDGGISAFWTYACPSGSEDRTQYEIDVELGGGGQYTNLWGTTWVSKNNKGTKAPDVSSICYMNDGKMHKYTFDWYTDYVGRDETRIDWFVDEQFVMSLDKTAISTTAMPIWLGLWLPSWAGPCEFETDYLLIDKISYKAFDPSTQYYESLRVNPGYTPKIPSESNIQNIAFSDIKNVNKLSNAGCESLETYLANDYFGWKKNTNFRGTIELSNEHTEGEKSFLLSSVGSETNDAAWYYQDINCAYPGFEFDLTFDGKIAEGSVASVQLQSRKKSSSTAIKTETVTLDSNTFKSFSKHIAMANNSDYLRVLLKVESGSANFDNFRLVKTN